MKKINIFESIKSVKKLGERKCEDCGATVPIYERDGIEVSICLECENKEIKKSMEDYRDWREDNALNKLIHKYEILPYKDKPSFDDYQPETALQKEAKQTSMNFSKMEETTLFYQGKPGLGKTHLSYCVSNDWNGSSLFMDMPGLMSTLRSSYNYQSSFSQEELMRLISDVDLFVLDDVGAEYVKAENGMESWVTDILYQIVNSRQEKRNIYTTNYKGKELQQKYGMMSSRIISRMMSNAKIIKLDGDDYRLKGLD